MNTQQFMAVIARKNMPGNVKLLLHFDGSDGSTSFVDSSASEHTVTADNAEIDTAQKKFGTASGIFDVANASSNLSIPHSDDFEMGSGDFTIDFWVRLDATALSNPIYLYGISPASTNYMYITSSAAGLNAAMNGGTTNQNIYLAPTAWTTSNSWTHVAFVRNGDDFHLYAGGTSISSITKSTAEMVSSSVDINIGSNHVSGDIGDYWIDEFRVVKGKAMWTSNFTPPTAPY